MTGFTLARTQKQLHVLSLRYWYEPEDGGLRGYPTLATIRENATDEAVGKKLWETAQAITGVVYPT